MVTASVDRLDADRLDAAPRGGVPVWLFALFFLSGASGLMYEVVWVRMLTRTLGNTVYATSTVLAAFMAGLAVGSFVIGRVIDRSQRPIVWYSVLELGIAGSALGSLALLDGLLPVYRAIYELAGNSRAALTVGQVALCFAVLCVPTALMGATLPTLSAYGARFRGGFVRSVATLYACNTIGAVLGVLGAGFVLIGEVGETSTLLMGVVLNLGVAVVAVVRGGIRPMGLARDVAGGGDGQRAALTPTGDQPGERSALYPPRVRRAVVVCFGLSGLIALASEVVWSRLLALYQGTSIYALSAMLGVMLAGMAMGSFWGGRVIDRVADALRLLAWLQLATALAGLAALLAFAQLGALGRADLTDGKGLWLLVVAPLILVGPLGLLSGFVFPVAARCYTRTLSAAGRSISELYAWNTVGCIAGALVAGFVLVPLVGASRTAVSLAAVGLAAWLLVHGVHPAGFGRAVRAPELAAVVLVSLGLAASWTRDPYFQVIQRRMDDEWRGFGSVTLYAHTEEAAGTTTAFGTGPVDGRAKSLWVNGYGMTLLLTVTKLMAHLPIALAENPRDVCVICFGMGTTVRSASRHEGMQVWAVELLPAVVRSIGYFHRDGPALLRDPNVHTMVDDGRNYLLLHQRSYDVITVDPAPPVYSAGTVNLYSREFFELCRDRLRPGGVMCLWIPPAGEPEVKMILRTFVDVFEHVTVWGGPSEDPRFQGLYVLGGLRPFEDVEAKVRGAFVAPAVVTDLKEWGSECDRPETILDLRLCDAVQLRRWLGERSIITDDRPYTEFPLWRALRNPAYRRQLTAGGVRSGLASQGE